MNVGVKNFNLDFSVFLIILAEKGSLVYYYTYKLKARLNTFDLRPQKTFFVEYFSRNLILKKRDFLAIRHQLKEYALLFLRFENGFELPPTSSFDDEFISKIRRNYKITNCKQTYLSHF